MNDFDTLQQQIASQIIDMYTFNISYTDAEPEAFRLIQAENGYYVWPLFCKPKRTSKFKFEQICKMADGFVADTEQREFNIEGWFKYDDFMNNYYNLRPAVKLGRYIDVKHGKQHGAQVEFAKAQGVKRQQVTQWVDRGFIVVDGVLCSPRRQLNV